MPFAPPSGDVSPSPDLSPGMEDVGGSSEAMVFHVEITDLYGTVLAVVENYSNLSFTMPISEDRSASVTLSFYEPAVQHLVMTTEEGNVVAALGRMVRIKFRGVTQFWGLVTAPKFSTEKATVDVTCQGPAYKLRHRQTNLGDPFVGTEEAPIHSAADYTTIQQLVEAAYDTGAQLDQNIPDIGIQTEHVDAVEAPSGFWIDIQRGANVWDQIIEVSSSAFGAEFDIVPYDPTPEELPFDTTLVEVTP